MHSEHIFFPIQYFVTAGDSYQFFGNFNTNREDFSAFSPELMHVSHLHSINQNTRTQPYLTGRLEGRIYEDI